MSIEPDPVRILFVCMGNICRSPTAHAVLRQRLDAAGLADRIDIDSAGTQGFHVGRGPDQRAEEAARARGYAMGDLRARQVEAEDLATCDYVIAMDEANLEDVRRLADRASRARITRLLDLLTDPPRRDVPDPYYGGPNGFEEVLDLVEAASDALIERVLRDHGLG